MKSNFLRKLYQNAYLLLTLTALFWAGNFVLGRGINEIIPPLAISFWRWFLAALIITPFAWGHIKKEWPLIRANIWFLLLLGTLSGAGFNALTYIGLHTTTATNALVLNSSMAMLIVLANFIMYRILLDKTQTLALIISFIGVMIIISKADISTLLALRFNAGDLLVFTAIVGWAIYTALLPSRPPLHWLSFTAAIFWAAALVLAPMALAEHFIYAPMPLNLPSLSAVAYATLFPGLLAYIFYNRSVELIGGNRAGIAIYLMPLFGTVLSIIFLGEQPELYHFTGFALIISGVVLSSFGKSSTESVEKKS